MATKRAAESPGSEGPAKAAKEEDIVSLNSLPGLITDELCEFLRDDPIALKNYRMVSPHSKQVVDSYFSNKNKALDIDTIKFVCKDESDPSNINVELRLRKETQFAFYTSLKELRPRIKIAVRKIDKDRGFVWIIIPVGNHEDEVAEAISNALGKKIRSLIIEKPKKVEDLRLADRILGKSAIDEMDVLVEYGFDFNLKFRTSLYSIAMKHSLCRVHAESNDHDVSLKVLQNLARRFKYAALKRPGMVVRRAVRPLFFRNKESAHQ